MNKEDLIRRWMAKAEEDLEMCRVALEHRPDLVEAICFHVQQAAEKSIKALLVEYDISFRKVHSLVYLLDLVADRLKDAERLYDLAEKLEGYSVEIRYSDTELQLTQEDAKKAYHAAVMIKGIIFSR